MPAPIPYDDARVITEYLNLKSSNLAAKSLGISQSTILRILERNQITRDGLAEYRRNATKHRGRETEIIALYESGATIAAIREMLNDKSTSHYAIRQAIKRGGGKLRDNPVPRPNEDDIATVRRLAAMGWSQMKISIAMGRSQPFVNRIARSAGIPTKGVSGANSSQWKGGRLALPNGYVLVNIPPDHPFASMRQSQGYVLEHRIEMAKSLGRPLRRDETVHHIDGNQGNNAVTNLQLRQGKHGKHVAMQCLCCGSTNVGPLRLD